MPGKSARLFLWRGRALVVGPGIDSSPHAHYAAQLTLGLDGPFRARLSVDAPWSETSAAIFGPGQTHQIDGGGKLLAHLFVELPQRVGLDVTALAATYPAAPAFAEVHAALEAARLGRLDLQGAEQLVDGWLACALPDVLTPALVDARIAQVMDWIRTRPDAGRSAAEAMTGAALAARVNLSPSRFTHLFRQKTGLSLSRYLLWNRLANAVDAVARGENMTSAAHAAGFADLAHMSRTFRNTFGVVASELQKMTIAFKRGES